MTTQDRRATEELRCKLDELIAPSAVPGHSCLKVAADALIFAALQKARAEERERCARLCGEKSASFYDAHGNTSNSYDEGCSDCASDLEDAIRALR